MKQHKKIPLPFTEAEFDELVKKLCKKFKLPNEEHAAAVVANQIMHLPPDCAETTLEHLGACVLKNIAFQVARSKGSMIQHKTQIDAIEQELTANPLNQQALDALDQAIQGGSEYAKALDIKIRGNHNAQVLNLVKATEEKSLLEQPPSTA